MRRACVARSWGTGVARRLAPVGWGIRNPGFIGVAAVLLWAGAVARAEATALNLVPGDTQSGGPGYGLHVGVTEVTNQQFVEFLNDTLNHPDDERGAYLYHAWDTGSVYLHASQVGTQGLDMGGVPVLDSAVNGHIIFDANTYGVGTGFESHPVTGVSWYGAVKYCNWLTIESGLSPSDRAYTEAPSSSLTGWHPVTTPEADWAIRDLDEAERQALLAVRGYRLPMDEASTTASVYNEWYKAAAWNPAAGTDWLYGFGRDTITEADANYLFSDDPFELGTTPAGYYDGTDHSGVFQTNDTNNAFGLYDLSGNVEEWVQDQGTTTDQRGIRGGSWLDTPDSLPCDLRSNLGATETSPTTGFRVVVRPFGVPMAVVDGAHQQPAGPEHTYRIGLYEVTNAEFAIFLNGALESLDDPRGAYLYHDTDTGDVYINASATGTTGTAGSGTLVFDASVGGAVWFDQVDQRYRVVTGMQDLPVVGASWYGAVKFCNWLAVESGLPESQRCYTEASYASGWHPVTITEANWAVRDLDDTERQELAEGYLGYRLPMDGGSTGASLYNEWFKAAAWLDAADTNGVYGFGRSTISGADANYWNSGDPFDDSPTPVGFYDGTVYNTDGLPDEDQVPDGEDFVTATSSNGYGLYDMSGNVWEWVQDQATATDRRAVRGGSWNSGSSSLRCTTRTDVAASSVPATTGFRIVQSMPGTLVITPGSDLTVVGLYGGPYEGDAFAQDYAIANMSADIVSVDVTPDRDWITVNGQASLTGQQVPAFDQVLVTVAVDVDCARQDAVLGLDVGEVQFTNGVDVQTREVLLTLTEPLSVEPGDGYSASGFYGGPFDPAQKIYAISNESAEPIDWSVATEAGWLAVNTSGLSASGQLAASGQPGDNVEVTVAPNAAAEALAPGSYAGTLTFRDECTGQEFTRNVTLQVDAPMTVEPETETAFSGPYGGPFPPFTAQYLLTNATTASLSWEVEVEPGVAWLAAYGPAGTSGVLDPLDDLSITVEPNIAASTLELGDYQADLIFRGLDTGFEVTRTVTLAVTELDVTPTTDFESSGPVGGPFTPPQKIYTIHNHRPPEAPEMSWSVTVDPDAQAWISLNGQAPPAEGSIVEAEGTATITISINSATAPVEVGLAQATITFADLSTGAQAIRYVNLEVGEEDFATPMVIVPADDAQPGGPNYDFRIARFEVTNAEFAVFLNNALNNRENERGHYMYHDTDSGDVYVHTSQTGEAGTSGSGTLIFDASAGGAISCDGQAYVLESQLEDRPVVGVSWYGAIKYCNWMTLAQAMDPSQRCYHEGSASDLDEWRPVTIEKTHWQTRDLDAGERAALLAYRGFRLPMDDGTGQASAYNEWYKAAAWLDDVGTNSLYGFGRAILGGADANFYNSGDPFDNDSTPVGFFDGYNLLSGGTPTNDTDNAYLLYDLCGNVGEWTQDLGTGPSDRAVRGGSMTNAAGSTLLRNDIRGSADAASVLSYIGFRVVQSLPESVTPLVVTPDGPLVVTGYVGGAFDVSTDGVTLLDGFGLDNPDADGAAEWIATVDQGWVEFDQGFVAGGVIPPAASEVVTLVLTEAAASLTEPAEPTFAMARVSDESTQPGGPAYGLWMGVYEVANTQYVAFLNDALDNPDNEHGRYMYFDTDSGDVYVNTSQIGEQGTEGETLLTTRLFEVTTNGRIAFDGGTYSVEAGFESHPVTGVSWFGAVKYCNWLSLTDGIPVHQLVYTEGPYAGDWHPATISTLNWWGTADSAGNPTPLGGRDLTADERDALVRGYTGFRLPMDGGATAAEAYNEWYLAAAWNPDASTAGANSVYGFGRDALTPADANYSSNGDPFEEGTTPVGFFDGRIYNSNGLPDEDQEFDAGDFQTADAANAFGIYDLTGNVSEWVQDIGSNGASHVHAIRGGGWKDLAGSPLLRADGREVLGADTTDDSIGFRVVQSRRGHVATVTVNDLITGETTERSILLVLTEPVQVEPAGAVAASGPPGGAFVVELDTYTLTNRSASPMDWQVTANVNWLDINTSGQSDSGQLAPANETGDSVPINLSINATAEAFVPDTYQAVLAFTNVTSSHVEIRAVTLTVSNTIELDPSGDWQPPGPFYVADLDLPIQTAYELINLMTVPIDYEVTVDQDWATLDDGQSVWGTLDPAGEQSDRATVAVALNEDVNSLGVGAHTATVTFGDTTFGGEIQVDVIVPIEDPLVVGYDEEQFPDGHLIASGEYGGPFGTSGLDYTLTNEASYPIDWEVTADVTWVDITGPGGSAGSLPAGGSTTVTVWLNAEAELLGPGQHTGTTTISNLQTGYDQEYDISLTVANGFMLTPPDDAEAAAPVGGPVLPRCVVYRLTNLDDYAVTWLARTQPPAAWVAINGQTADGGALAAGQFVDLCVSVDQTAPELDSEGTYTATVEFERDGVLSRTRQVVLTVTQPMFALATATVPGGADQSAPFDQPGGPAHAFQMGVYEVTNAQFADFLNDALANTDNERGQYLYHDIDSGDVYINDDPSGHGDMGTGGSGTLLFDASAGGGIHYDGGAYVATSGLADRPVVGVTWYGAVKFCNWLTIDQGLPRSHRCYAESTASDLDGWRPMTIAAADWATRDLADTERQALVDGYLGYRLPMDDGSNNGQPWTDAADAFNEWYKAAAWDPVAGVARAYGFGRDAVTGADANYWDSGDPFDNGPTPAGYYDGTDHGGVFQTSPTDNAYGLFDLCGDVHEWMQDRYASGVSDRALRGGSFEDLVSWIGTDDRSSAAPSLAWGSIGLRVMRVFQRLGDGDGDGDIDLADYEILHDCLTGPQGGLLDDTCRLVNLDADGDVDLGDFAAFQTMLEGL